MRQLAGVQYLAEGGSAMSTSAASGRDRTQFQPMAAGGGGGSAVQSPLARAVSSKERDLSQMAGYYYPGGGSTRPKSTGVSGATPKF